MIFNILFGLFILLLILTIVQYYRLYRKIQLVTKPPLEGFTVTSINTVDDTFNHVKTNGWLTDNHHIEVYVISLPNRKKTILNTLNNLGIQPHIYNAFLKSRIKEERQSLIDQGYITPECTLNDGRIACHISHTKVLRNFIERIQNKDIPEDSTVLIFEDDLASEFTRPELENKIKQVLLELPLNWEYVNFGRCWAYCKYDQKYGDIIYKTKRPLCRHAYMLTRSGANKVTQHTLPMTDNPGDHMLATILDSNKMNGYVTNPNLFSQNRAIFGSTLGNNGNADPSVCVQDRLSETKPQMSALFK